MFQRLHVRLRNIGRVADNALEFPHRLRRRLEDAFLPDNRILGIKDYVHTFRDVRLTVTFTALTVFGDVPGSMEVTLA